MDLTLRTERLVLTPFTETDADILVELFTDPAVRRYTGGAQTEKEVLDEFMSTRDRRGGPNGCLGAWVIKKPDGRKIGACALVPLPIDGDTDWGLVVMDEMPEGDIEIGYHLIPAEWGKGYATEACRRLVRFAFEDSPLDQVVANFEPGNTGSRNVLLKSGFLDCGTRRAYGDDNAPYFRITREEWLRGNAS